MTKPTQARWNCKYHVMKISRCGKRELRGKVRKRIEEMIRRLCQEKEMETIEEDLLPKHIHRCLSIASKHSVAFAIGLIKEKGT
jgi:putative transposase